MGFIQIIDFHTDRMEEGMQHVDEYVAKTRGKRTSKTSFVCRDRDQSGHYVNIVSFDSYESAMKNSNLPETQELSSHLAELAKGSPIFLNLEVEYAQDVAAENAATMSSAYDRINAGNLAGFGDLMADDFVEHEEQPGLTPTKQGVLEWFGVLRKAFPDLRMHVEDVMACKDRAVARVRCTGTHQAEFMGVPPTGNPVDMNLIDIMRFDDRGLICEHWGLADTMSMMQQLGVIPAGPPA